MQLLQTETFIIQKYTGVSKVSSKTTGVKASIFAVSAKIYFKIEMSLKIILLVVTTPLAWESLGGKWTFQ